MTQQESSQELTRISSDLLTIHNSEFHYDILYI